MPDFGISVYEIELPRGIERGFARSLLHGSFRADDQIVDLSAEHGGSSAIFSIKKEIFMKTIQ